MENLIYEKKMAKKINLYEIFGYYNLDSLLCRLSTVHAQYMLIFLSNMALLICKYLSKND